MSASRANYAPAALLEAALDLLTRVLAADAGTARLQRPRPADERRAVEALRHMDAHAAEPLSLTTLAERARLTGLRRRVSDVMAGQADRQDIHRCASFAHGVFEAVAAQIQRDVADLLVDA